jgi:aryl-alcohol dehydrogenase-like predicted oxidoreductase
MKYRTLGKTGYEVSEISLGAWQIGGRWGEPFNEKTAEATLHRAVESGITFVDTADGYGGGLSERVVGRVVRGYGGRVRFATKCGRRLNPHVAEGYTPENIRGFVEDSLRNTGCDALDLIQLHCPPTRVYYTPAVFDALERLKAEGKIRAFGVSVEKVEEALKAIEFPGLATVQIIFNIFRQRPADLFFAQAKQKDVGIIVRVPLASGLLTGALGRDSRFAASDHRAFNRNGEKFDRGETFAGVDYETGLAAVEELKSILGGAVPMPQVALRWILMFPEVGCVIPGASRAEQAVSNAATSALPALSPAQMAEIRSLYERRVKPLVHHLW